MGLTRKADSNVIYLQVKHYCLWQEIKKQVNGCEAVEVTNPKTGAVLTKYGYRFDTVTGRAVKLIKYDTEKKYATRYFGFKLHMVDGADKFVLDMPYNSFALRRFLRVARNIDWTIPLSITVFKGKKKESGSEETGIWFQQGGATVKPYYTKEQPHGMPEAYFDTHTSQWDFRDQHRWLVTRLIEETIPDITQAAEHLAPPEELVYQPDPDAATTPNTEEPPPDYGQPAEFGITDDDIPF